MKIYNVPYQTAVECAAEIGVRFKGVDDLPSRNYEHRIHGVLRPPAKPAKNPYQRTSADVLAPPHLVGAVCWHGYRDFMQKVFERYPDAIIITSLNGYVRYNGKADFMEKFGDTYYANVGSLLYPQYAGDVCEC